MGTWQAAAAQIASEWCCHTGMCPVELISCWSTQSIRREWENLFCLALRWEVKRISCCFYEVLNRIAQRKQTQSPLRDAECIAQGTMDLSCNTQNSDQFQGRQLYLKAAKHLKKLPREAVESLSIQLDKALSNLILLNLFGAGTCLD